MSLLLRKCNLPKEILLYTPVMGVNVGESGGRINVEVEKAMHWRTEGLGIFCQKVAL